jgi:hypothetical protein
MSVDFKEVPDKTHDEVLHLMETDEHIADVLCPCGPRLIPVKSFGNSPSRFTLACRHYEPGTVYYAPRRRQ